MPTWIERQPAQRLRSFRRKRGDNLVEARIAAQRVAAYLAVLAAARDLLGPHLQRRADQGRFPASKPDKLLVLRH